PGPVASDPSHQHRRQSDQPERRGGSAARSARGYLRQVGCPPQWDHMPETRRVVVTGLGAVTPVGNTVADAWASLLAGCSGIGAITLFDTTDFSIKIGGEVKNFVPE